MGINCFATLSVPFCGLNAEGFDECLRELPEYLKEDRVVGIGEIGLDTGKNTVDLRLNSGAVTGLSVCYDKLTAEEAAEIVINNAAKRGRIMLGSELGYGGAGHLSVVKVAWAMKMSGLAKEEIEKVTWDNPKRFFNLPVK